MKQNMKCFERSLDSGGPWIAQRSSFRSYRKNPVVLREEDYFPPLGDGSFEKAFTFRLSQLYDFCILKKRIVAAGLVGMWKTLREETVV